MEKTKLYLLSGFLGSGKTTVLRGLLSKVKDEKVGIIQNELGKVSIDGKVLSNNEEVKLLDLTQGSIFCTCLRLQFVKALADLSIEAFDYVIVESSGFGDPSNFNEILEAVKVLAGDRYEFCGVISLVDCLNFQQNLREMETVERQLKHCHIAIITKTDLVDEEQIKEIKKEIRKINPICSIECSRLGELNINILGENFTQYQWAGSEETTNSAETKPKTFSLSFKGDVCKEELDKFLKDISSMTFRVKGFLKLKENGWTKVDVVGSQIDYIAFEEQEESRLIIISKIGVGIIRPIYALWEKDIGSEMKLSV